MKGLAIIIFVTCIFSVAEAAVADTCDKCTDDFANSDVCSKTKTYISCLIDTYQDNANKYGCDQIKTKMEDAKTKRDTNCGSDPATKSCLCEIDFYKSATLDCAANKTKLTCLFAARDVGCDGTTTKMSLVTAAKNAGKRKANCITDTCKCQAEFAESDVSNVPKTCREQKKNMHCLANADGVGCDGTSSRSAIANSADTLIASNCKNGLTKTCKCAINYAKTDATTTGAKCKAAKVVQECLTKITDTADKACDDTTLVGLYLSETMVPKVTTLCNDAASLNGVGLALGILLMFQDMARQI